MDNKPGSIINNVLIGHDDYLFLHEGNYNQFSYLSGKETASPESRQNFLSNFYYRKNFAAQHNIEFLHVVFPCKPLVLRQYCPDDYRSNIRSLFLNSYSPLFPGRDHEKERILYPLSALINRQTEIDCYWKNDTHINAVGQLCVYREISKHIQNLTRTFPMLRIREQMREGDLGMMLGKNKAIPSLCFPWLGESLQFSNTKELAGNSGDMVISFNPLSKSKRRLVLFGDSFIKTMLHLFAEDFQTILYIRGPYFQPDIIHLFSPDVLITSETERYLAGVDNDDNGSSLLFSSILEKENYVPNDDFKKALVAELSYQSHPTETLKWEAQQKKQHSLHIKGVGDALHNRELKQLKNSPETFEATGDVPVMHIHTLTTQPYGELEIDIQSDVHSLLKITVLRECLEMSSLLEVHEYEVTKGRQSIRITIDHSRPIDGLLFQPLHHAGKINILKFGWKSITTDEND